MATIDARIHVIGEWLGGLGGAASRDSVAGFLIDCVGEEIARRNAPECFAGCPQVAERLAAELLASSRTEVPDAERVVALLTVAERAGAPLTRATTALLAPRVIANDAYGATLRSTLVAHRDDLAAAVSDLFPLVVSSWRPADTDEAWQVLHLFGAQTFASLPAPSTQLLHTIATVLAGTPEPLAGAAAELRDRLDAVSPYATAGNDAAPPQLREIIELIQLKEDVGALQRVPGTLPEPATRSRIAAAFRAPSEPLREPARIASEGLATSPATTPGRAWLALFAMASGIIDWNDAATANAWSAVTQSHPDQSVIEELLAAMVQAVPAEGEGTSVYWQVRADLCAGIGDRLGVLVAVERSVLLTDRNSQRKTTDLTSKRLESLYEVVGRDHASIGGWDLIKDSSMSVQAARIAPLVNAWSDDRLYERLTTCHIQGSTEIAATVLSAALPRLSRITLWTTKNVPQPLVAFIGLMSSPGLQTLVQILGMDSVSACPALSYAIASQLANDEQATFRDLLLAVRLCQQQPDQVRTALKLPILVGKVLKRYPHRPRAIARLLSVYGTNSDGVQPLLPVLFSSGLCTLDDFRSLSVTGWRTWLWTFTPEMHRTTLSTNLRHELGTLALVHATGSQNRYAAEVAASARQLL